MTRRRPDEPFCFECCSSKHNVETCPVAKAKDEATDLDASQRAALTEADPEKRRTKFRTATDKRIAREAASARTRALAADPAGELARWNAAVKSYGRKRRAWPKGERTG